MQFPHLNDTKFPNIGNVDVYAYKNDFDYTRWSPDTKLNLVNVKWNGDYNDVVKFESDAARDAYFDRLAQDTECSAVLNTNVRLDKNQVKLPIPFDVACMYNYLVVDVPVATSEGNMLANETADGFRRWHFFVQDWHNTAPSTTVLTLALDVWTQYINSVGISYMMLERGHAPVAATDVDAYLANPLDNSGYLLAKDVDYGNDTVCRDGKFIPFGNGAKLLCFASTCPASQLENMGTASNSGTFASPTFSDAVNYPDGSNRWGYQYQVHGFDWGTGKSYLGTSTPAGNAVTSDGRIPNNATVYAMPVADASSFLSDIVSSKPMFMGTLLACFMVDSSLVTVGSTTQIAGHEVSVLRGGESDLGAIELDRSMFGYADRYAKLAKLYTYPYARLELTDNAGKSVEVRIESTSGLRARAITSIAFPYINMRMFIDGVNGVGSETYKWADLAGTHDEEMLNSDWYRCCFDYGIPTYTLLMDGQTSWVLHNWSRSVSNGRLSALTNYHNSVRQADNACANSMAEASTAESNANASADTQSANAKRSSSAAHTNTNNNASTLVSNNANSCAANTDITANNNATMIANTTIANRLNNYTMSEDNAASLHSTTVVNGVSLATTKEENQVSVATTSADVSTGITTSMVSGAVSGGIAGSAIPGAGTAAGAVVGAVIGGAAAAAGAWYSGNTTKSNANIVTQANSAVTAINVSANTSKLNYQNSINQSISNQQVSASSDTTNNSANNNSSNAARQNSCATANTNNTAGTMRTNAANTDNANIANADASNSTAHGNSARTRSTSQSNSTYTRNAAVVAAQDVLRNTQNSASALAADARNMEPVRVTAASGDMTQDYMRNRGVQVKVRTQSESAIRQAGDEFTRHGYALNQIWDVEGSGLCLMKHFTYWKSSDCWCYDRCETNDAAQNTIAALFNRGVTVWSNPDEVGRVNPYDN